MSCCAKAMLAANMAVSAPVTATVAIAAGLSTITNDMRHSKYTPAVTMVAAWIRALTGVGPAIASGNQTYNGSCALLPAQPRNNAKPTKVAALTHRGALIQASALCGSKLAAGTWVPSGQT